MSQLYALWGIKAIKMSPYHPQTDCLLERWHYSLLVMLKKASTRRTEIYTFHSCYSHIVLRFTQLQVLRPISLCMVLMFAVHWKLLEVMRDQWLDGGVPDSNLVEWVEQVQCNLRGLTVLAVIELPLLNES